MSNFRRIVTLSLWITVFAFGVRTATADVLVRNNVAFTAVNQNPWTGGPAFEEEFLFDDLRFDYHVDLPDLINPTGVAINLIEDLLEVNFPFDPGIKAGGSVSGHFGIDLGYYVSGGRLNINYPAVADLNIQTPGADGTVVTGRTFSIGSAFSPGTQLINLPLQTTVAGAGGGYQEGETSIPGFEFEVFSQPTFSTWFPYAQVWATADYSVNAGVFIEADYVVDKARKDFRFGDSRRITLVEADPKGIRIAGAPPLQLFDTSIPIPAGGTIEISYPDINVNGTQTVPGGNVLQGEASKPVIKLLADFDKIVPFVGPFLSNNLGPINYSLLSTDGGPVLSLYQDMSFTAKPRVRLQFSEQVMARTNGPTFYPTSWLEFELGQTVDIQPIIGSLNDLRIQPTYILDNSFKNETGVSLGVEFHLQALNVDTPLGHLGPAYDDTRVFDGLVKVPLFDPPEFTIPLGEVTANEIVVPKSSILLQDFPNSRIYVESAQFISEDPESGQATYAFHFIRTPSTNPGDPGGEYYADITGLKQGGTFCDGDNCVITPTFITPAQEFILNDALGTPLANLGSAFCVGCSDQSEGFEPVSPYFTDDQGQGIYLTKLTEYPDGLVDVDAHPVLGADNFEDRHTTFPSTISSTRLRTLVNVDDSSGPRSSFARPSINNQRQTAYYAFTDAGTQGIFRGDGVEVTTIVDNTGPFASFNLQHTAIRDDGSVAFFAVLDNGVEGVYTGNSVAVETVVDTAVDDLRPISSYPDINDSGSVAFYAQATSGSVLPAGIFKSDGVITTEIATTLGEPFFSFDSPAINSQGQVAFKALYDSEPGESIWLSDGNDLLRIADTSGPFASFFGLPDISDSGQVAFQANLKEGGQAIYLSDGNSLTLVVDTKGPFQAFGQNGANIAVNSSGSVAFIGHRDNADYGLYIVTDGLLEEVIGYNDPLFGSRLSSLNFSRGLNDNGDVAFFYTLADGRSGIATALVRDYRRGDYDSNGTLDAHDLDLQSAAIAEGNHPQELDLNGDTLVNIDDRMVWIKELKNTWFGDANLDGEFNTGDLVHVLGAGRYETRQFAGWSEGDWNGDAIFDTGDFVIALQDGGYEQGPRAENAAVPEPSGFLISCLFIPFLVRYRRGISAGF